MDPKGKGVKAKLNDRDCIKLRSFCTAKETANETNRQPAQWEKVFVSSGSDWSTAHPPVRREETVPTVTAWTDLENSVLSEVSQARKDENHMASLSRGT